MKYLRFLLMAALVALPLTACDEDDETVPVVVPIVGTVSGTVSVESTGLAGVTVTLSGATSQTVTTGAGGSYSFTGVEAGNYGVTISGIPADVSFPTTSATTAITTQGQTVTVDFNGSYIRTAAIGGEVLGDGAGIAGVGVTATGPEGEVSDVTDSGGNYSFTGLRAGDYTVAIDAPAGWIFAVSSQDVTLGVGEAEIVSFFGEAEVVIDPVTASVVIKTVTTGPLNMPVNPAAVVGQIEVTLQIDPGENELSKIALFLDDMEVGSQTLSQSVPMEELIEGVFEVVFTINTAAFDAVDGTPTYPNKVYDLAAKLSLENAQASEVTTSMQLTFANVDTFIGTVTPDASAIGANGLLYWKSPYVVDVLSVPYSGKTVSSVTVQYNTTAFGVVGALTDAAAPFQLTFGYAAPAILAGFNSAAPLATDLIQVAAALYSDGSVFPAAALPVALQTAITTDNVGPAMNAAQIYSLPEQVTDEVNHPVCCANNWVNPAYTFASGMGTFADNLLGVDDTAPANVTDTYRFGTVTGWPTTAATRYALPAYDTPGDSGEGPSMVNTTFATTSFIEDRLGNWTEVPFAASLPGGDNPLLTLGLDAADPTAQAVAAPGGGALFPDMGIYNAASAVTPVVDGLAFTATEDRAGFSATPLRTWLTQQTAAGTTFLVGAHPTNGGQVNEAPTWLVCGAGVVPINTAPCLPAIDIAGVSAQTNADAYYNFGGLFVDQGGNEVDTEVARIWLKDSTLPTTNNIAIPTTALTGGASTNFGFQVQDNLDLWEVQLSFDFEAVADSETGVGNGVFIPFGDPVMVGDNDRWDGAIVTSASGSFTVAFVQSLEGTTAAGVPLGAGTALEATSVRAITVDAAGNQSAPLSNNFLPSTITTPATITYATGGMTGFAFSAPAAAVNLCNGQGLTACPETAAGVSSVTLTAQATGPSGTYANPFMGGTVYFYLVGDPVSPAPYYAATNTFTLIGSALGSGATFTDTGALRTYSWSMTLSKSMLTTVPAGPIDVAVIGVNGTGDAILAQYNANITTVPGT